MKIGIFGGTFSPPHKTHIEMAEQAIRQLDLSKLYILPNAVPPHKPCKENETDRLKMAELAFGGIDKAAVDTYEIDKGGNSYTYQTLLHFREKFPDDEIYLVIGGDSLRDFPTWVKPDVIAKNAVIAVCRRAGSDFNSDKINVQNRYGADIVEVNINLNDISSTKIRVDYQFGADCADRVPQKVDEYIKSRGLYSYFSDHVKKLKTMITPPRFSHTYHTTLAGLRLPSNCDRDKIFLACLLHDCAKNMTAADYSRYCFTPEKNMCKGVVHAFLGALVAEKDFGITDTEILDAIRYHTTARPDMTELEMVVYTADKIEDSRPYATKHLYADTLEKTFLNCLLEVADYVSKRLDKTEYDSLTKQAIDYYKKRSYK